MKEDAETTTDSEISEDTQPENTKPEERETEELSEDQLLDSLVTSESLKAEPLEEETEEEGESEESDPSDGELKLSENDKGNYVASMKVNGGFTEKEYTPEQILAALMTQESSTQRWQEAAKMLKEAEAVQVSNERIKNFSELWEEDPKRAFSYLYDSDPARFMKGIESQAPDQLLGDSIGDDPAKNEAETGIDFGALRQNYEDDETGQAFITALQRTMETNAKLAEKIEALETRSEKSMQDARIASLQSELVTAQTKYNEAAKTYGLPDFDKSEYIDYLDARSTTDIAGELDGFIKSKIDIDLLAAAQLRKARETVAKERLSDIAPPPNGKIRTLSREDRFKGGNALLAGLFK